MKSALICLSLAAAMLGGCGYTTDSQYRTDVKTIAVPIFKRSAQEYRRDIEIRLSEAVVKQIARQTPYRVEPDQSKADTVLLGTLRRVTQTPMSFESKSGNARDLEITLHIDLLWKDLRNGQVLKEKKDMQISARFIPLEPFDENFFQASGDAINKLAIRIVEQLAANW